MATTTFPPHGMNLVALSSEALERVASFRRATIEALAELLAAAGLDHPSQLMPAHFSRRVSAHEVRSFAELYPALKPGELLAGTNDKRFAVAWAMANAGEFRAAA